MAGTMPGKLIVFDTSVVIPLLVKASRSTRLFLRLQAAEWQVVVSPRIVAEAREKLENKQSLRAWLQVSDEEVATFLDSFIPATLQLVQGVRQAHGAVPADPKDDIVIAAALESKAGYIVSEDKHLLDLKEYQGIKIMNREQFEAELDRSGVPE